MANFVELTNQYGVAVVVNVDKIQYVLPEPSVEDDSLTLIHLEGAARLCVEGSIDTVMAKILRR
ncbi:hypothetical protein [Sapientia aquatica]|jgi:hypothetical protein|uniref:Uncharacterized protein n=1 Tax=Sapientia aquatica TaxID=1549640 RepID=A0A4R5VYM1_9BURK|nr:hypothetical protein [Sapientia aquatica]TDK63582.1 hypothetical protein E2I14_15385 [Sapientia aquatica]